MQSRVIAIPRLLHLASGCLSGVSGLLSKHDFDISRICIGSGEGPSRAFAEQVVTGLRTDGMHVVEVSGLRGTLEQSAQTAAVIIEEQISVVIGVGGGRVIDTMKLAAARTGTEFVSIPTTIAHDGISSPVASLIGKDGSRTSHAAVMPAGIIVDLNVIDSAPRRTLRSGVGDLVSNLTAVLDWRRADTLGVDHFDAFSAMIAESAAWPILSIHALERADSHQVLANGLLLSGLAMAAAGTSRPCSGAEHLISHSLDRLLGENAAMHGEQVALGCLLSAAAHESSLLSELQELFGRLGLPTAPAELEISEQQMLQAIIAAPATRPDRYTILSEAGRDEHSASLLMARAFISRKNQNKAHA
jgi:glycerol-1-phosphate dehydrogenase [NAD(P)+]